MFIGRSRELEELEQLKSKKTASLVVLTGRRRIGKSTLVEKFASSFSKKFEFQGLAPREGQTNKNQLDHFSEQLSQQLKIPAINIHNWTDAFSYLASYLAPFAQSGHCLVFLDEISWMASKDSDFAGKLKVAWDTKFKHHPQLILITCGSVTSWIEKNILKNADFVGRISLAMNIEELELKYCNEFWGNKKNRISATEKFRILNVTGGVPKYLEEINTSESAESNIKRLCFKKNGFLFSEFDRIFNDIFSKRAVQYKKIITKIIQSKLSAKELANALKMPLNGDFIGYLHDLEISGFISRETNFKFDTKKSGITRYRIKDNYLRFYLKYIEPVESQVRQKIHKYENLETMREYNSIMGLQFENLVYNNFDFLLPALNLNKVALLSAAPYYQPQTKTQKKCQIDLLIQTKSNTLYLCEIKFRNIIGSEVIREVQEKIERLKYPKKFSIRPVLIFSGELSDELQETDFFDRIVDFKNIFEE